MTTPLTSTPSAQRGLNAVVGLLGLILIVVPAFVRSMTSSAILPFWDTSPLVMEMTPVGLSVAGSLLIDTFILLGCALMMGSVAHHGRSATQAAVTIAAVIATIGVLIHAFVLHGGGMGDRRVGMAWVAGLWALVAIARAPAMHRRVAAGALLGWIVMLGVRGIEQVSIEHPETVRAFTESREAWLSARGWTEGSSSARAFERRLLQPEASGWFALANPYATFMAAGTFALAWLCGLAAFGTLRSKEPDQRKQHGTLALTLGLGCAVAGAGLILSNSLGGWVAASVSVCVGLLALLLRRLSIREGLPARSVVYLTALAMFAGPLTLIWVRSMLGESVGELSLLFRGFYLSGASRIFAENPFLGVGPDGFQQAYLLAKPPESPEEVTSPHSILLDYLACLGAFGLAWVSVIVWSAVRNARAAFRYRHTETDTQDAGTRAEVQSRELRALGCIAIVSTLVVMWLDFPMTLVPELLVVRLVGLFLWVLVGALVMRGLGSLGGYAWAGVSIAGLGAIAHAQIEVTPVLVSSAVPFMVLLATGAGSLKDCTPGSTSRSASWRRRVLASGAPAMVSLVCLVLAVLPALRWEGQLRLAGEHASVVRVIETHLAGARSAGSALERQGHLRALRQVLDTDLSGPELSRAARVRTVEHLERAGSILREAWEREDDVWQVRREAVNVLLAAAVRAGGPDGPDRAMLREAVELAAVPAPSGRSRSAGEERALGLVCEKAFGLTGQASYATRGIEAYERACALDPYSFEPLRQAALLADRLGETDRAGELARRSLRLHEYTRFDAEARSLPAADLRELERLAGVAGTPPPAGEP